MVREAHPTKFIARQHLAGSGLSQIKFFLAPLREHAFFSVCPVDKNNQSGIKCAPILFSLRLTKILLVLNSPIIASFAFLLVLTLGGAACSLDSGANKRMPAIPAGGAEAKITEAPGRSETYGGAEVKPCEPDHTKRVLCVFDYDLTISSHACEVAGEYCRTNSCGTYSWFNQCLAPAAREAFKACVDRGAFIGINSHAGVDECWSDKVVPIVAQNQFPELTNSPRYDNPNADFSYPAIDDRANWNCNTCAYHMNPNMDKSEGVRKVMRHYGMDADSPADRARVIFWDDSPGNITNLNTNMPEVRAILVPRAGADEGGCGITRQKIIEGWNGLVPQACTR